MGAFKTGVGLLVWVSAVGVFACSGKGTCTQHPCKELTPKPVLNDTLTICDRGDGYVRLEDSSGKKLYECFCSVASMKDAAAKICSEGAVCRKAGSACSTSGDCCAGLHCTVNVCG